LNRLKSLLALLAALLLVQPFLACHLLFEATPEDPGVAGLPPRTTAIFCDIEADRRCATNDEIMMGIDVSMPFQSGFWLGKSSRIGLDYSQAAANACGGGPRAVVFHDAFPTGTPVCLNPGQLGAGAAFETVNLACKAWCSEQQFEEPGGTPYNCQNIAWQSNGVPPGGFPDSCTTAGTRDPAWIDPRTVRPANPVVWTMAVGVAVNGSNLAKTAPDGWGSQDPMFAAGAVSARQLLAGNGAVTVDAAEIDRLKAFGLGNGANCTTVEDVEFAFALSRVGTLGILEKGVAVPGVSNSYLTGDRLEVAVEEGFVVYKKNDAVIYTSTVFPTYPLRVEAAFFHLGATLIGARTTF